jgi:O-antigen ligase
MLPSAESIQIILPIASILFLGLSFKRTIYGVISYFIILNAKIGDMYPSLGAIRFELVAAAIVFISIFISGKGLRNVLPAKSTLNKPLWVLFVMGMLSVPQAVDVAVSWENGGYELLKLVLFYIMVVASIHEYSDLRKMIWAFVLVTAWIAYEPVSNYLRGEVIIQGYGEIATGRFGAAAGHVALANTLSQGIPIGYFFARSTKNRWIRILILGLIFFLIVGVVFTKSRGGFIGLVTIAVGLIFFSRNRVAAFLVMMIAFLVLGVFVGSQYFTHMSSITDGIYGSRSSSDRYIGLRNGIEMMLKRPVLGVGIGCYAVARRQYFNYYFYSHNLYGELIGELGLASLAWFYWIYAVFRKTKKVKQEIKLDNDKVKVYYNILTGVQLGLFLRLVLGNFTHSALIWFWFLMAAYTVSIEKLVHSENIELPKAEVLDDVQSL